VWSRAVAVARELGVNRARVALGVSYGALRARVARESPGPAFIELSGAEVLAAGATAGGTSVEISGPGVHVVVRVGDRPVDLATLIAAVRGRA
jgi:hypothetical protein